MKIKRFNESLEDDNPISISRSDFKELDGEIWISQSDLLASFNLIIKETANFAANIDRNANANITNGQLVDQLTILLRSMKEAIKKVGGKTNPLDPYGEEDWEE